MSCKNTKQIPTYDIYLTRGDTFLANLTLKRANGSIYTPEQGDEIVFAVKRNELNPNRTRTVDAEPLIYKVIPSDTLLLELDPSDTEEMAFLTYMYDVSVNLASGGVRTVLRGNFTVQKEAHSTWTITS